MRRAQTDLYDSFHLFQKRQESTRLLLETNEILNYFQNKKYNVNFQIINRMLWIGALLPFALAFIFNILKNQNIISPPDYSMLFFCSSAAIIIYLLTGIYIILNKQKLGRMDDIIISTCKNTPLWSLSALKSASLITSSLHNAYEKRLSTFKLICTVFPVILALVTNIFSESFINIYTSISKDIVLSVLTLFVICGITLLLVIAYIELIVLVFYINHCSSMKASIDFLISISESNSFE